MKGGMALTYDGRLTHKKFLRTAAHEADSWVSRDTVNGLPNLSSEASALFCAEPDQKGHSGRMTTTDVVGCLS